MDENKMKHTIAANIAAYRKAKGMTQAELAAALNYSDKSVSKWERAEGVPDIYVLTLMSELFGVTLNDLVFEHDAPIEEELAAEEEATATSSIFAYTHNRFFVAFLSAGIVWLTAAVVFFFLKTFLPDASRLWTVFIYALPVMFIVFTVFSSLWRSNLFQFISVSGLIWSAAISVVLSVPGDRLVSFYLIALVLQVMTVIWYVMRSWNQRIMQPENSTEDATEEKEGIRE